MSMGAWTSADPLRHPWFLSTSLKRKHSDSSSDDETPASKLAHDQDDYDAMPTVYRTPPQELTGGRLWGKSAEPEGHVGPEHGAKKKRRCDLERKMARLQIEPTMTMDGMKQQYTVAESDMDLANVEPLSLPPPFIPRLIPSPQPISQANSTSSYTSNSSYATAQSYAFPSGSISPVPRSSILAEYAIEEPVSPELDTSVSLASNSAQAVAPEVRMKGSDPAWYEREKDRIVITDLDELIEELEKEEREKALEDEYKSEAEPHPDASEYADSNADYSISSVLLDHLMRQPPATQIPNLEREKERGALILFRPPPVPLLSQTEAASGDLKKDDVQVEEIDLGSDDILTPPGGFEVGTAFETDGESMDMDVDM